MSGLNSFNSTLAKIGNPVSGRKPDSKPGSKPFRVAVLGQSAVGKSAMVVRFITRRFIGEYDSAERTYPFNTSIDNEIVNFEILDSTGQLENECLTNALETNIRWAEAFILMYSVTDKCSFEEVNRLKFLINYNKRRRKIYKDDYMDCPVILVANKIDQFDDRMVTTEEGQKRSQEIGCACFHEISVRESVDETAGVFRDLCRFWRFIARFPKLKRSKSDSIRLSMTLHSDVDPDKIITRLHQLCYDLHDEKRRSILLFGRSRSAWHEDEETDELELESTSNEPFRSRAKTDGNLLISRTKKWKIPGPPILSPPSIVQSLPMYHVTNRRNSISMKGHVSY